MSRRATAGRGEAQTRPQPLSTPVPSPLRLGPGPVAHLPAGAAGTAARSPSLFPRLSRGAGPWAAPLLSTREQGRLDGAEEPLRDELAWSLPAVLPHACKLLLVRQCIAAGSGTRTRRTGPWAPRYPHGFSAWVHLNHPPRLPRSLSRGHIHPHTCVSVTCLRHTCPPSQQQVCSVTPTTQAPGPSHTRLGPLPPSFPL